MRRRLILSTALIALAAVTVLGIPLGAVLAIGDQWNDIEMLAEVGHGTAMPTAPAEVQV